MTTKKTNELLNHPFFNALRLGEQVFEAHWFTPKSEDASVGTDHGVSVKLYGTKSDVFKKAHPVYLAAIAKAQKLDEDGKKEESTALHVAATVELVSECCVDWKSDKVDLGAYDKAIFIEAMNHEESQYIAVQSLMFILDTEGKNFFNAQS